MDNNRSGVARTDNRLWKIQDLFEIIRVNFSKFYNSSEHLAVDKVIVKFKGRVVCKQFIPPPKKKRKHFSTKMFIKLRDSTGFTYDMNVYPSKHKERAAQHLTATHATLTNLMGGGGEGI
jgi:hypothetical protein